MKTTQKPTLIVLVLGMSLAPTLGMADCMPVSGTIDATVVDGEPINVLGNVTGDLAGATRAVVTSQAAGENGAVTLGLAHDFVAFNRGSLHTTDVATWTPVPGHEGVYHMSTEYVISGGTGAFAGASGLLINDGIADTTNGLVTLRYAGEVCVD